MDNDGAVLAALADVTARLHRIEEKLDRLRPLSREVPERLPALLRALVGYGDGVIFRTSDVIAKCDKDDSLHDAVLAACGSLSAYALGQLFAANKDVEVNGLILKRAKRFWAVQHTR